MLCEDLHVLQPFIITWCIPMNLELSYHPWCWGRFNPLSSTSFMICHLCVETNSFYENLGKLISLFQQNLRISNGHKLEVPKLEELVRFLLLSRMSLGWGNGWGSLTKWKSCIDYKYICENLNPQMWSSYAYFRVVKVHWLNNECLSQWSWRQYDFEIFVAQTTKDCWSLQWTTTLG